MKKTLIWCLSASFLFLSCDKNEDAFINSEIAKQDFETLVPSSAILIGSKSLRSSYKEGMDDYENFAKEVAKKLNDKEMRRFFKSEASKQFDGDYDILVRNHLEKFKGFETLINQTPKLNIGFNELIEKWDFEKKSILVASRVGLNPNSKVLIAYDAKGEKYEIDGNIEPDQPIMVIGYNERVEIVNGKTKLINFQNVEDYSNKNSKLMSCSYPYRSGSANYEKLKGIKFNDLSVYEQWYDFKPEIRFRMYSPISASNFSTITLIAENFYQPSRSSVNGSWWNFSAPLFIWNTPNYSTTMLYEFTEIDDYGQSSTVTIGLSGTYGIGSNNSSGTPNITQSITPSIGFSFTKKGADMVIGRLPYGMLDCPPNSDDSYQFNAGNTAFYFKAGY